MLQEKQALNTQWSHYINPLNQVFLFLGGYLTGLWTEKWKVAKGYTYMLFGAAALLFVAYPVEGNVVNLVTDTTRMVFTLLCFIMCFSMYKTSFSLPAFADHYLKQLGEASYSVYLLHPIVWFFVKGVFAFAAPFILPVPMALQVGVAVGLTLLLSHQVYFYFERFFMQAGKKVSGRVMATRIAA